MRTTRQARHGVAGRPCTDRAGADRRTVILERHRTTGTAGHRCVEGDATTVGAGVGRARQVRGRADLVDGLRVGRTRAAVEVAIAAICGRDAVAAHGKRRGREHGRTRADRARANRRHAVVEGDGAGGATADRGVERDRSAVGAGTGRTVDRCRAVGLVHYLANRAAGAARVVGVATIDGRDAMATGRQAGCAVRGRGAANRARADRRCAVIERDGARRATGDRGRERHAAAIGAGVGRTAQAGRGCTLVDRKRGGVGVGRVIGVVEHRPVLLAAIAHRRGRRGVTGAGGTTDIGPVGAVGADLPLHSWRGRTGGGRREGCRGTHRHAGIRRLGVHQNGHVGQRDGRGCIGNLIGAAVVGDGRTIRQAGEGARYRGGRDNREHVAVGRGIRTAQGQGHAGQVDSTGGHLQLSVLGIYRGAVDGDVQRCAAGEAQGLGAQREVGAAERGRNAGRRGTRGHVHVGAGAHCRTGRDHTGVRITEVNGAATDVRQFGIADPHRAARGVCRCAQIHAHAAGPRRERDAAGGGRGDRSPNAHAIAVERNCAAAGRGDHACQVNRLAGCTPTFRAGHAHVTAGRGDDTVAPGLVVHTVIIGTTTTATARASDGDVAAGRGGDTAICSVVIHTVVIGTSGPAAASTGH